MSAPFLETSRVALLKSHTRVSSEDPADHMGTGQDSWSLGPDGLGGFQCMTPWWKNCFFPYKFNSPENLNKNELLCS